LAALTSSEHQDSSGALPTPSSRCSAVAGPGRGGSSCGRAGRAAIGQAWKLLEAACWPQPFLYRKKKPWFVATPACPGHHHQCRKNVTRRPTVTRPDDFARTTATPLPGRERQRRRREYDVAAAVPPPSRAHGAHATRRRPRGFTQRQGNPLALFIGLALPCSAGVDGRCLSSVDGARLLLASPGQWPATCARRRELGWPGSSSSRVP
jgi:hypothetical protein